MLTSCHGQTSIQPVNSGKQTERQTTGDTVTQLSNNIMVVFQSRNGNYWFGSWQDGLYKYDGNSIVHFSKQDGLPDNRVEEIQEDKFGNVFINTKAGLCKYDGRRIVSIKENFLPSISNWGLQPDDLWFKSTRRGCVCRYDGKSLTILRIPGSKSGEDYLAKHPGAIDPYGIYSIYKDSKGNIWFGTAVLGALRYNGKSFDWISEPDVTEMHNGPANGVRSIIEDKDGYFWFNAEYRYKVFDSDRINGKPFYNRQKSIGSLDGKNDGNLNEYLAIAKDKKEDLWIATYQDGVWKYDGSIVRHYSVEENGKAIKIFYIYRDHKDDIWLGTPENGVWKLKEGTFSRFKL